MLRLVVKRSFSSVADPVLLQKGANGVAVLTLNRPADHNCLNDEVIRQMNTALTNVRGCADARVLQLRASGKSFCAGADLKFFIKTAKTQTKDQIRESSMELMEMLNNLNTLPIPTIAMVQGPAYGGGVGIVSCCDVAVGVENATTFALSEVKLGMIPATISPYVVAAIGNRNARRYFVTAEAFNAQEALRMGLLHHVCGTAEELDQWVAALTQTILKNGPNAVQQSKRLVADVSMKPIDIALMRDTAERLVNVRTHPESAEGIQAFLEKRKASWIPDKK